MSEQTIESLAIDGGEKAFSQMTGQTKPKVGLGEFLAVAKRFGFNDDAIARLEQAVSEDDLIGDNVTLARYYCSYPELVQGSEMEKTACELFGSKYALSVSSGTGALHSAFVAAGVGPGTEVIVPAVGFMATSCAVIAAGGVPVFCDIDESLHLDPTKIEAKITPRTVAVAPTHHWGGVADMDPIMKVCRANDLKVIEDCAQAPGAKYKGRYVGTIGDLGCFSISCYKIIGGGEGGMVLTDNERLYERTCQLAECGGLWRKDRFAPPRYEGELFSGTNYRMSELEATINVVQLSKLNGICNRFRQAKSRIVRQLKTYREITPQKYNDVDGQIGYLLRLFPETIELGEKIVAAMNAEGVGCSMRGNGAGPDWHQYSDMFPVIDQTPAAADATPFTDPRYVAKGGKITYSKGDCPVADDLYRRCIAIGINQWYSPEDCDAIAKGITKVLDAYCTEDAEGSIWM